ncbi:glycosyl transferase family protein, partial [Erwinia tracheiphila PSU-1]
SASRPDFLNDFFHERWQPLPYICNALKTLLFQHARLWDFSQAKNIHFIIDKSREKSPDPATRDYALNKL